MVQLGSSPGYDGFTDDYHSQNGHGSAMDDGLRAAVRGLVDSVNATSRQLADAAESFARETVRVMEGFVARVDGSAGETRDMAGLAGRAADEARRISEEARGHLDITREQMRSEVESMIAGVRAQLDDALRSTAESVEGARLAADEADRHSRDTGEKVEQSLLASRQAASAAEAAAEAARRSAEGIEQAVNEARQHLRDEATQLRAETSSRVEEALAASREAAAAAERAAECARSASLQAVARAADAVAPEPAMSDAAHRLLDRLEADYALLTQLVQSLQAHVSGPSAPQPLPAEEEPEPKDAESVPAVYQSYEDPGHRDPVAWKPPAELPAAVETEAADPTTEAEPVMPAEDPSAVNKISPDGEQWDAWSGVLEASASVAGSESIEPAIESGPIEEHVSHSAHALPEAEAVDATPAWPNAAPRESTDIAPWWTTPSVTENEADIAAWAAPAAAQERDAWPEIDASAENAGAESPAEDVSQRPSSWHWSAPDSVEPESEPAPSAEAAKEPARATIEVASLEPGVDSVGSGLDAHAGDGGALVLSGRVILHISPVPDFDRLLNLDSALGRVRSVRTVTLADYAKEQVTFRLEMEAETPVDDFAKDLATDTNQQVEVAHAEPGEVQLRIVHAGA